MDTSDAHDLADRVWAYSLFNGELPYGMGWSAGLSNRVCRFNGSDAQSNTIWAEIADELGHGGIKVIPLINLLDREGI